MKISFDPAKRERTLQERQIDFLDAARVFEGLTIDFPDLRKEYGEARTISIGYLDGRMVMIGWTQPGASRPVFTMRKCNAREQAKYRPRFAV